MKLIVDKDCAGIYVIEALGDYRFYIGQTDDIHERYRSHISLLRNGRHFNLHLQRLFIQRGESEFVMGLLEPVHDLTMMDAKEQEWVNEFWDRSKVCLNIKRDASKPPCRKGCKMPVDAIRKISEAKKGRRFTEEHKSKIAASTRGHCRCAKMWNVKLIDPDGYIFGPIRNLSEFGRTHGIYSQYLSRLIRGHIKEINGWRLLTTA